jgi:hypothetical protein
MFLSIISTVPVIIWLWDSLFFERADFPNNPLQSSSQPVNEPLPVITVRVDHKLPVDANPRAESQ